MTLTRTYTKTYALLDAWASSVPWDCLEPGHSHTTMVGDPCAVPSCREPLLAGEEVYAVLQFGGPDAPESVQCRYGPLMTAACGHAEQYVCWRHVRPDQGPVRA